MTTTPTPAAAQAEMLLPCMGLPTCVSTRGIKAGEHSVACPAGRRPAVTAALQAKDDRIAELEGLFDLRWKADMRAIERWRAAAPGRELTMPDRADLGVFLLEQIDELSKPIDMIMECPSCGLQHVDEPDERTPDWVNPPHRSHLCHGCGNIWRPCDRATNGVRQIASKGKADSEPPVPMYERLAALQALMDEKAELEAALAKHERGPVMDTSRMQQSQRARREREQKVPSAQEDTGK